MRYTIPQRLLVEADEAQRRAERQAQVSGSSESKVKALLHAVRQGQMDPGRVQVMAALGDTNAVTVANTLDLEIPPIAPHGKHYRGGFEITEALSLSGLSRKEMLNFAVDCLGSTAMSREFGDVVNYWDALMAIRSSDEPRIKQYYSSLTNVIADDPSYMDLAVHQLLAAAIDTNSTDFILRVASSIYDVLESGPLLSYRMVGDRLLQYLRGEV